MLPASFSLAAIALSLAWFASASAAPMNVTIDDTYGDSLTGAQIQYEPADAWNTVNCSSCTARPNPALAVNGTWHDCTYDPGNSTMASVKSATVRFNGSAVYVFGILAHTIDHPAGRSDLTFTLDGRMVSTFLLEPTGSSKYDYDFPVLSLPTIDPGQHVLKIENGLKGKKSLLILDSVIYTNDDSTAPSSSSSSLSATPSATASAALQSRARHSRAVGAIAGSISGVALLLFAVLAFFLCRRRRAVRRARRADAFIEPVPAAYGFRGGRTPGGTPDATFRGATPAFAYASRSRAGPGADDRLDSAGTMDKDDADTPDAGPGAPTPWTSISRLPTPPAAFPTLERLPKPADVAPRLAPLRPPSPPAPSPPADATRSPQYPLTPDSELFLDSALTRSRRSSASSEHLPPTSLGYGYVERVFAQRMRESGAGGSGTRADAARHPYASASAVASARVDPPPASTGVAASTRGDPAHASTGAPAATRAAPAHASTSTTTSAPAAAAEAPVAGPSRPTRPAADSAPADSAPRGRPAAGAPTRSPESAEDHSPLRPWAGLSPRPQPQPQPQPQPRPRPRKLPIPSGVPTLASASTTSPSSPPDGGGGGDAKPLPTSPRPLPDPRATWRSTASALSPLSPQRASTRRKLPVPGSSPPHASVPPALAVVAPLHVKPRLRVETGAPEPAPAPIPPLRPVVRPPSDSLAPPPTYDDSASDRVVDAGAERIDERAKADIARAMMRVQR